MSQSVEPVRDLDDVVALEAQRGCGDVADRQAVLDDENCRRCRLLRVRVHVATLDRREGAALDV